MELPALVAKGGTADVYLYRGNIVKVFHSRFSGWEPIREADKQRRARFCGLPVPAVYHAGPLDGEEYRDTPLWGKQALVMEHMEGPTLGELIQREPKWIPSLIAHSVEIQREMHKISVTGMELQKDRLRRQIRSAEILGKSLQDKLMDRLDTMPLGDRLCHGDFHLLNLIRTSNGTAIIDWVDASAGHPWADVCRTYVIYLEHREDLAEEYMSLCCAHSGMSREEILKWLPVIAGARLAETAGLARKDQMLELVNRYL